MIVIADCFSIEWKHCIVKTLSRLFSHIIRFIFPRWRIILGRVSIFIVRFVVIFDCIEFISRQICLLRNAIGFGFSIKLSGSCTRYACLAFSVRSIVVHIATVHCDNTISCIGGCSTCRIKCELSFGFFDCTNATRWFWCVIWKMNFCNDGCSMWCRRSLNLFNWRRFLLLWSMPISSIAVQRHSLMVLFKVILFYFFRSFVWFHCRRIENNSFICGWKTTNKRKKNPHFRSFA